MQLLVSAFPDCPWLPLFPPPLFAPLQPPMKGFIDEFGFGFGFAKMVGFGFANIRSQAHLSVSRSSTEEFLVVLGQ